MRFYHFGDSYATVGENAITKHFCELISDNLGYEYIPHGVIGLSNEQILNKIIEMFFDFNENDIIFINFSFFQRGCWYDSKSKVIKSTNKFYNELEMYKTNYTTEEKQKISSLLNYYIEYPEDYGRKLFRLFNSALKNLVNKNVKLFYIFIEETEWSNDLMEVGSNIRFANGFGKWLIENDFHLGQDNHYTSGIQPMLCDVIQRKTLNLQNHGRNTINISTEDIDITKIIKVNKSIL